MNILKAAVLMALLVSVLPVTRQAAPFLFLGGSLLLLGRAGLVHAGNALLCLLLLKMAQGKRGRKLILYAGAALEAAFMLAMRSRVAGLSYTGLMLIGLLIEGAKTDVTADPALLGAALYYPCLHVGPIVSLPELRETLRRPDRLTWARLARGLHRICLGLFKKTVVADRLAPLVDAVFSAPDAFCASAVRGALLFYALALYMDFSGAMDIVVGLSALVGIDLPENFRRPYLARSFGEYWRRWHITMGAWFRTYVFYPLAACPVLMNCAAFGMRHAKGLCQRRMASILMPLLLTWSLTGLWHGLSFHYLAWGLANGLLILLEAGLGERKRGPAWIGITFFVLLLIRVLFRAPSLCAAGCFYRCLLWGGGSGSIAAYLDGKDLFAVAAGTILLGCREIREERGAGQPGPALCLCMSAALLFLSALFGVYGPGYSAAEFYYGRF